MRSMRTMLMTAALLLCAAPAGAGDADAVEAATAAWVDAFNAREPRRIAALYAPDAVFWGTVSPTLRTTPEAVEAYFAASVARSPKLRIGVQEQQVRILGDTATNSGIYVTRNPRPDAEDLVSVSRFTFVYQRRDGGWVIVAHHSSRMPAP
jgi:uncharacterized protein (TIGR02246 family)